MEFYLNKGDENRFSHVSELVIYQELETKKSKLENKHQYYHFPGKRIASKNPLFIRIASR